MTYNNNHALPDLELEYGSGSDVDEDAITWRYHSISVSHHRADDAVTRATRRLQAKEHLLSVIRARRDTFEAIQVTMRTVRHEQRRQVADQRRVIKQRALQTGRQMAENMRITSDTAIGLLLQNMVQQQVKAIMPPRVRVVEVSTAPALMSKMDKIVDLLDKVAPNVVAGDAPPSKEVQDAVASVVLPDPEHENMVLLTAIRNEIAQEQGATQYPLCMWLDFGEGWGKRFAVVSDEHLFYVLWQVAEALLA